MEELTPGKESTPETPTPALGPSKESRLQLPKIQESPHHYFRPVYDQYLKAVPKELRRPDMPMTPDIHQPSYVNSKEFSAQARNHQPSLCDLAVDFVVLQWMICLVFRIPGHVD